MKILEINQLSKVFHLHGLSGKRIEALSHVDFSMEEGEIVGLTGQSGSGKSSLMKCIYRTYLATSGEMWYRSLAGPINLAAAGDHSIIALRRQEITYCSQFLSVIPRVPAVDVVSERIPGAEKDRKAAKRKAMQILERLGLPSELWDAYPVTFSGGEQQRINVARAIAAQPRFLLIDEPTASLDQKTKDVVIGLIAGLKNLGTSVLCISHDSYTLEAISDRRVHLESGQIVSTENKSVLADENENRS